MRGHTFGRSTRFVTVLALAVGWLLGLALQAATRIATGYMDIFPPGLALGVLLCLGAGFGFRVLDPVRRTAWRGALGGVLMAISIVAGYAAMVLVAWNPAWSEDGGETPISLLIELPFWVGLPLLVSAACGAAGWLLADRLAGSMGAE